MPYDEIRGRVVYVNYSDARRIMGLLKSMRAQSSNKSTRTFMMRLWQKLEMVRDMDYSPAAGYQLFLGPKESDLYHDCRDALSI